MDSVINQFRQNDLFRSMPDPVHSPDPLHLILSFKYLCEPFSLGHFHHQPVCHLRRRPVDLLQMIFQLAAEEQPGVNGVTVMLEKPLPPEPPNTDLWVLRRNQVRDKAVAFFVQLNGNIR